MMNEKYFRNSFGGHNCTKLLHLYLADRLTGRRHYKGEEKARISIIESLMFSRQCLKQQSKAIQ
jgi:hypothetical protein